MRKKMLIKQKVFLNNKRPSSKKGNINEKQKAFEAPHLNNITLMLFL